MTILDNVLPEPEKPKEGQVNVNILPGEADIQDLVKQEIEFRMRERKLPLPDRFHVASPTNETNAIRTLGSMIAILMKQAGLEEVRFTEEALYDYKNHAISVQREFDRQFVIVRTI